MTVLIHERLVDVIRKTTHKLRHPPNHKDRNAITKAIIADSLDMLADELEDAFIRKAQK